MVRFKSEKLAQVTVGLCFDFDLHKCIDNVVIFTAPIMFVWPHTESFPADFPVSCGAKCLSNIAPKKSQIPAGFRFGDFHSFPCGKPLLVSLTCDI